MFRSHRTLVLLALSATLPQLLQAAPRSRGRWLEEIPPAAEWSLGHGQRAESGRMVSPPKAFVQRHPGDWSWRIASGPAGAWRAWGTGIDVGANATGSSAAALSAARAFWQEQRALLPAEVSVDDLRPIANQQHGAVRYVGFEQTVAGVPVLGSSAFVAIERGRLVLFGARLFAPTTADPAPAIVPAAAVATAQRWAAERGVTASVGQPHLTWLPLQENGVDLELVFAVELRAPGRGRWTAYVDASKGDLRAVRDERRFLNGQVQLEHHERDPLTPLVASPGLYLGVGTAAGAGYSDGQGGFTASGTSASVDLSLQGRYAKVNNLAGTAATRHVDNVADQQTLLWQSDGSEFEQAQLDAYRSVTVVREYAKAIAPDVEWLDEVLPVNVNYDEACNAWFDGELTFLRAGTYQGETCNNSAMIADIVYHEFGHGLHAASVIPGVGSFDEATSEGFGDFLAASITGDHLLAPNLTTGTYLRDLEDTQVWPDDQSDDPHQTGLIVSGALWDLRAALIAQLGEAAGTAVVNRIFGSVLKTTSDVPSLYESALLADDDNGDLADGTPHVCAIESAFRAHGLVGGQHGVLEIDHTPPGSAIAADVAYLVSAEVRATRPQCGGQVGGVRLVYSLDDGASWQTEPLVGVASGPLQATLPAAGRGSQIRYRIEADELTTGVTIARPSNPAEPYFVAFVGDLAPIVCHDLESDDGGFVHQLISGASAEGADDWQWGTPTGRGYDPDQAYSGAQAWGNDLALSADWNGLYQADKINALDGPVWDLDGHSRVRLQFRRWLTVEDGLYDHARVLVNGQEVWSNRASDGNLHHLDGEWALVDIDLTELLAQEPLLQVRWQLESDPGKEFGGWNIDDVCVYDVVEPAPVVDVVPDGREPVLEGGRGCAQAGGITLGNGVIALAVVLLFGRRRSGMHSML